MGEEMPNPTLLVGLLLHEIREENALLNILKSDLSSRYFIYIAYIKSINCNKASAITK